ncbi:MAG: sensor histidine kinase [Bacteroidota bacterium]
MKCFPHTPLDILFFLAFLIACTSGISQTAELDSLKATLSVAESDSFLASSLAHIGIKHSLRSEKDSAEKYFRQGMILCQTLPGPQPTASLYKNFGTHFFLFGAYDSAECYYQAGLNRLKRNKLKGVEWANILLGLGNIASYRDDVQKAIDYWIEAAGLHDSLNVPIKNLKVFANLGSAFSMLQHFDRSEYYFAKAIPLAEKKGDLRALTICYGGLGGIYEKQRRWAKADSCFQECLELAQQLKEARPYRLAYFGRGKILLGQERYEEAIQQFQLSLQYASSNYDQALAYLRIGMAQHQLGLYAHADQSYLLAQQLFQEAGVIDNIIELWKHITENKVRQGDFEAAFEYFQRYYRKADSMAQEKSKQRYEEVETKFRTEQQKLENLRLQSANTQQKLELQHAQAQARQRLLLVVLLIGLLLGLLIGFVLYRRSTEQKRRIAEQAAQLHRRQIEHLQQTQKIAAMQAMVAGQETERHRLARDLHDSLGGLLSSVQLNFARSAENRLESQEDESFSKAMLLLQKASKEIRDTAHNLMPANLMNFGLIAALEDFFEEINFAETLSIEFQPYGMDSRLPDIYERSLYRIIQELLNNILKHAQAKEVLIQLFKKGDRLHLTVEDDGIGFDLDQVSQGPHFGLNTLRSRVDFLNGSLDIDSQPDKGTSIYMEFYLNDYDTFTRRG